MAVLRATILKCAAPLMGAFALSTSALADGHGAAPHDAGVPEAAGSEAVASEAGADLQMGESAEAVVAPSPHAPMLGLWLSEGEGLVTEFYECEDGARVCGRIAWLKKPRDKETGALLTDTRNSDAALRDRTWCGMTVIKNLRKRKSTRWKGGAVYNPDDGNSYGVKAKVISADRLDVRLYLGIGLLGKTEVWRRVDGRVDACDAPLLAAAGDTGAAHSEATTSVENETEE